MFPLTSNSFYTTEKSNIRARNKAVILNKVYWFGPISRTEIAKTTGIRSAGVSELSNELVSEGFLKVAGYAGSIGGRKRELLNIDPEAGYVIGLDVGAARIRGILIDFAGNEICSDTLETRTEGRDAILGQMADLIRHFLSDVPQDGRVFGIGVGVAGVVDRKRGFVNLAKNLPGWRQFSLNDWCSSEFELPLFIENSVNAMARAEEWFGKLRGSRDAVFINLGVGLGAAIIADGKVYGGFSNAAGEVGGIDIYVESDSKGFERVSIGNILSGAGIAREAKRLLRSGRGSIIADTGDGVTAQELALAAEKGDGLALELFRKLGYYLGELMVFFIDILNPEFIVVGGGLARAGHLFLDYAREVVETKTLDELRGGLKIELSTFIGENNLWDMTGSYGAASLVLEDMLAIPQLAYE